MKHAKFALIEQATEKLNVRKDTLRLPLKRQEDFWTVTLKRLVFKGLNQELDKI